MSGYHEKTTDVDREPYRVDHRRDSVYTAQLVIGKYVEIANAPPEEQGERLDRLLIGIGRLVQNKKIPLPKEGLVESWRLHNKIQLDDLSSSADDVQAVVDMLTRLGQGDHSYVRWLKSLLA